jgi:hypothetical protein
LVQKHEHETKLRILLQNAYLLGCGGQPIPAIQAEVIILSSYMEEAPAREVLCSLTLLANKHVTIILTNTIKLICILYARLH